MQVTHFKAITTISFMQCGTEKNTHTQINLRFFTFFVEFQLTWNDLFVNEMFAGGEFFFIIFYTKEIFYQLAYLIASRRNLHFLFRSIELKEMNLHFAYSRNKNHENTRIYIETIEIYLINENEIVIKI